MTDTKKRPKRNEFGTELSVAVEKAVREKLGLLDDAVLLGNKIYKKPTSDEAELDLQDRAFARVEAKLALEKTNLELGENVNFEIELENVGKSPVTITRIEGIMPNGFEVVTSSNSYVLMNTSLDMHGKKLDPYVTENVRIMARSSMKGTFIVAPRVRFVSETGRSMSCQPEPVSIQVSETILPNRVKTGFKDLDNLLFGGIPEHYTVVLTSDNCDERDLLIKRFLEAGAAESNTTLHVTLDAVGVRSLAEDFASSFHVLVCNPKLDETMKSLPNVVKCGGVENLTEMSIALESVFRRFGKSKDDSRRACLDIVSDVLLQHHAVQTRRWLTGLIPELRSRGFTTLALLNPHMHSTEEMHAVLDLFEGEISIYEKKGQEDTLKYLRIRRMQNQRYLDGELPLRRTRLMSMPATVPCCTRTPNI